MHQITACALITALLTCGTLFSQSEQYMVQKWANCGVQTFGETSVDTIRGHGEVVLEGTRVRGGVSVNGQLDANNADLGWLDVNGEARLRRCVVNGETRVRGRLVGSNNDFQGTVKIWSERIELSSSRLTCLEVHEAGFSKEPQKVVLSSGTIIDGPIIFHSGEGQVFVETGSAVSGDIIGGEIRS